MDDGKPNLIAKIAVLESQVGHHTTLIGANQVLTSKLVEKLDGHIQNSMRKDAELQVHMTTIGDAVNALNDNIVKTNESLVKISNIADASNSKWGKVDTITTFVVKICLVLAFMLGTGWTITQFYDRSQVPALTTSQVNGK